MTSFVQTENSRYEIDTANKQMRRIEGINEPTANQREDGAWRSYVDIHFLTYPSEDAQTLFVVWGMDGKILRQTVTSRIKQVEGDPLLIPTKETIL